MENSISRYPFIFSQTSYWRWRRHVSFWLLWWVFQGILYSFISINRAFEYQQRLISSMAESGVYLVAHIVLAYLLCYWVLPRYLLRQQYAKTIVAVAVSYLLSALLSTLLTFWPVYQIRDYFGLGQPHYTFEKAGWQQIIFFGLMAGLRGAITIGGIAAAIKLMKYWYLKEQRNLQLQQENIQARLDILKAQIHPHFLFNVLNNIYSYAQPKAPDAAQMLLELSQMLRYMLYETHHTLVPLSGELQLLQNYVALERARYGNQLDIQFLIRGETGGWQIAPLLLLPLLENAFKHGASQLIDAQWISFQIQVNEEGWCRIKVLNGQPQPQKRQVRPGGIGLKNLRKRMELLYTDYQLETLDEPDVFIVNMALRLVPCTQVAKPVVSATP